MKITTTQHRRAALYARVSSDRQKEEGTVESQVEALLSEAKQRGWQVPEEWIFRDEGYSGATLERPGLEILRDLVFEGEIETILVYAPDRLARKYALQALLLEEFSRHGATLEFVRSVKGETPEAQLLQQFQGMIAEYERSMIVERCRRGKRHKAKQGRVNVLCGAPYGYHYHKISECGDARYEIKPAEAAIVRQVYAWYTEEGLSIGDIVRKLNASKVPTRNGNTRWERTTVWGMLKNPAYKGKACFGKTKATNIRAKSNKKQRERGGPSPQSRRHEDVPQDQWIEINVPTIITEATFEWAQQKLAENRQRSKRRTIEPSLLQSMLVCEKCGYALYRTSTKLRSGKSIYYYRCIGSDNYRFESGRLCDKKPIRVDILDDLVWSHLIVMLRNPNLIEDEVEKRKQASRESRLSQDRQQHLHNEILRLEKQLNKLLDAYQEDILTLEELRHRSHPINEGLLTARSELAKAKDAAIDEERFDAVRDDVNNFLRCLQARSEQLTSEEKQQIVRLLIKEVIVSNDTIKVHHSIPIPERKIARDPESYLLCTGRPEPNASQSLSERAGSSDG